MLVNPIPDSPSIDSIIVGWAPGFGKVCHRRSVQWYSFTAGLLIGLGSGLMIALVAIKRPKW
jgi:hypothetical protein